MARGGYGGRGVPLHARTRPGDEQRATGHDPASAAEPPPVRRTAATESYCPARHCWVRTGVDGAGPRPGLLLEWRREDPGGWFGRVVYAAELRPGRWATVEEWVPAELLDRRSDVNGR